MSRTNLRIALALSLGALACGDANAPAFNCTDDPLSLSVANPTTTPRFSWAAGCPVTLFEVFYVDSTSTVRRVWQISPQAGTSPIASPVTYGQIPAQAVELVAAQPLEAGRGYQVHLIGGDPQNGTGFIGLGGFTY